MNAADGADGCALTAELTEGWSADLMGNLAVADAADAVDLPEIREKGWTFRVICFSLSTALTGIRADEDKTDGLALGTDLRAIRLAGSHFVVRLESVDAGCFISVRCLIAGCLGAGCLGAGCLGAGCLGAGCFIALAVAAALVPVADVVVGCQWAIFVGVHFVTGAAGAAGAIFFGVRGGSTGLLRMASAISGRRIGYVGSGSRTCHWLTWAVNRFLRQRYPASEALLLGALADAAVVVSGVGSVLAGASPVFWEVSLEKACLVRDPVKVTLGPKIPMTMKWDIDGRSILSMSLASRGRTVK